MDHASRGCGLQRPGDLNSHVEDFGDVAIEALRDSWQRRIVTIDEIDRYARICRVDQVMRPYLEALLT